MLIDTHCHLHDRECFTSDQQTEFLDYAHEHHVEKLICIGTNHEDSLNARAFAAEHDGVYWTYGIHPEFCMSPREENTSIFFRGDAQDTKRSDFANSSNDMSTIALSPLRESPETTDMRVGSELSFSEGIRSYGEEKRVSPATAGADDAPREKSIARSPTSLPVAIGEIGLDYHYDGYDRTAQIRLFEQMLQLARDHDLPVSLHLREAFADAFAVLDNFPGTRGVVHSFTGSKRNLRQALERGFYIGVNGLVTYTTPPIPPLDRILLETDAPFLTPVPFRGTINQPGYVADIAAYLAGKLGETELTIEEQTTKNAREVFRI